MTFISVTMCVTSFSKPCFNLQTNPKFNSILRLATLSFVVIMVK